MESRELRIGIVGPSGAVGAELLRLLREDRVGIAELRLFGDRASAGDVHEMKGEHIVVRPFDVEATEDLDVVVLATPADASAHYLPLLVERGVFVVDASAAARSDGDVPVVVPAVNRTALQDATGVVASPGSFVPPIAVVLDTLLGLGPVRDVDAVGLASVAEMGRGGMEELSAQVVAVMNQRPLETGRFPAQVAFNVIPSPGTVDGGVGPNPEERRLEDELREVLGGRAPRISATLAYVPVFCGHSVALRVAFEAPVLREDVVAALDGRAALSVLDVVAAETTPTSLAAVERDEILVGRVHLDPSDPRILRMWLSFDNLRWGAALNLVAILVGIAEDGIV